MRRRTPTLLVSTIAVLVTIGSSAAAQGITTPKQQFGFNIGDDYLPRQLHQFVDVLAEARQRIRSDEGRRHRQDRRRPAAADGDHHVAGELQEARSLQGDLTAARDWPRGSTDDQARALAKEGKARRLDRRRPARDRSARRAAADRDDLSAGQPHRSRRRMRIPARLVILAVHANPDGMELVSNWYMREPDPPQRSTGGMPRLYQKYVGHDNNRDFYMSTQPETHEHEPACSTRSGSRRSSTTIIRPARPAR